MRLCVGALRRVFGAVVQSVVSLTVPRVCSGRGRGGTSFALSFLNTDCYSRFSDGNARVAGIETPLIYDAHTPVTKQIFNVMWKTCIGCIAFGVFKRNFNDTVFFCGVISIPSTVPIFWNTELYRCSEAVWVSATARPPTSTVGWTPIVTVLRWAKSVNTTVINMVFFLQNATV